MQNPQTPQEMMERVQETIEILLRVDNLVGAETYLNAVSASMAIRTLEFDDNQFDNFLEKLCTMIKGTRMVNQGHRLDEWKGNQTCQ